MGRGGRDVGCLPEAPEEDVGQGVGSREFAVVHSPVEEGDGVVAGLGGFGEGDGERGPVGFRLDAGCLVGKHDGCDRLVSPSSCACTVQRTPRPPAAPGAVWLLLCLGCHYHQYDLGPPLEEVLAWQAEVGAVAVLLRDPPVDGR
jgi:hypothetical protein